MSNHQSKAFGFDLNAEFSRFLLQAILYCIDVNSEPLPRADWSGYYARYI